MTLEKKTYIPDLLGWCVVCHVLNERVQILH
jgi:hypothetical protein